MFFFHRSAVVAMAVYPLYYFKPFLVVLAIGAAFVVMKVFLPQILSFLHIGMFYLDPYAFSAEGVTTSAKIKRWYFLESVEAAYG